MTPHPDSEILTALAEVRRLRAWIYSFDDAEEAMPDEDYNATDEVMQRAEDVVHASRAKSTEGVAARLELLLASSVGCREVDRLWAEHGIAAVYEKRQSLGSLDGNAEQLLEAIHDLRALYPTDVEARP